MEILAYYTSITSVVLRDYDRSVKIEVSEKNTYHTV